jgi:predicted AAA+ superfamily ATPase
MYQRIHQLTDITERKSILLLGPRQTGKSTLLRARLPIAPVFNLLDAGQYRSLSADPTSMRRQVLAMSPRPEVVVIDEVQRLPELLNEVHLMIEEHRLRFVLTGSSARALRRRGVNLLAGRARTQFLHPLVSAEVGEGFDLSRAINHGLLPAIYDSDSPDDDLRDYVGTYLREEIAAEGLTRNLPGFSRFLEIAALCNGQILNHTKIAADAEVKRTTVIDYFQVLADTLIGFELPPWRKSKSRKAIATSKHYLFDLGVARHLAGIGPLTLSGPSFGVALEHFIFRELRSAIDYGLGETLHYWRSTSGFEVDFLLDERIAIEVKAARAVRPADLKGLSALREELPGLVAIVVAMVERPQLEGNVLILPWREFVQRLWRGELRAAIA